VVGREGTVGRAIALISGTGRHTKRASWGKRARHHRGPTTKQQDSAPSTPSRRLLLSLPPFQCT
jgi:hypothetical protein